MVVNIGAQMYTVREFCQTRESFERSMERVAAIGYKTVQISGGGDFSAETIREIAYRYGLSIILTHTDPVKVRDRTEEVIRDHRIMGAGYVGIGMMPGEYRESASGIDRFIADFTPAAEKLAAAGLKFMYHNHSFEFEKFDGNSVLDRLIEGFDKNILGFTLDVYWVAHAGADPAYWLRKLAGRIDTIHLKDMEIKGWEQRMCEVMEGNLNWDAILTAAEESGVKHAFVEQDDCYGRDPFDCLSLSYRNLTR